MTKAHVRNVTENCLMYCNACFHSVGSMERLRIPPSPADVPRTYLGGPGPIIPAPLSRRPNIVILPWYFDTILIKDDVGLWIVPPPPLPLGTLLPPRSPPCISRRFETACAAPLSRDVPAVFIPVWQLPKGIRRQIVACIFRLQQ